MHAALTACGLSAAVKTSGSRGLHIVVPVADGAAAEEEACGETAPGSAACCAVVPNAPIPTKGTTVNRTDSFNDDMDSDGGSDVLIGDGDYNVLDGEAGNDVLIGGGGSDSLSGDAGGDSFVYTSKTDSTISAADWINDFTSGEDKVVFDGMEGVSYTGKTVDLVNGSWTSTEAATAV